MKTFTQLVTGDDGFTKLSNNESTANIALGKALVNNQYRYLLQRYFDNERTVTTSTVGSKSLTLTGALVAGATSATLSSAWTYPTVTQLVNFSDTEQRSVLFTNSSTAITWSVGLNNTATSAITTVGVQYYSIPADVSKIKNNTITIGQLQYQPTPVQTREEWDLLNGLPYSSDIPNYYFIWNGTLGIFPIPSTTGNVITFNYKTRVPDMTFTDYSTATLAAAGMVAGSTSVTGLTTVWGTPFPTGTNINYYNLAIRANPPFGDGIWYPISQFNSNTSLTLAVPVINAPNITASTTYTIGQLPLLQEDFHDMLIYGALMVYFTSIVDDSNKFKMYESLYKERLSMLEDYAGTKQVNVDLGAEPQGSNPNLFIYAN